MLSIKAIINADYYLDLAIEDYFFDGGEPPGTWLGSGSKRLGVRGLVRKEALEQLILGFSPNGRPMTQNAGSENRQAGWDLTFSAPKSVSVLWELVVNLFAIQFKRPTWNLLRRQLLFWKAAQLFRDAGKAALFGSKSD